MPLPPVALPVLPDPAAPPRESSTGRKFPCPKCGAALVFDPGKRALLCPFCAYSEAIEPDAREVQERDWEEYWRHTEEAGDTIAGRSSEVRCKVCGAVVLLEDKVVIDQCPYCGNDLENTPVAAASMILPEGILPFRVDMKRAAGAFREWMAGRWFAPNDLKHLADVGRFNGVYVPFWTYDAMTYTRYTGQRGDNYMDTETFTTRDSNGNLMTQTRQVIRTRWSAAAGQVEHFFDDVLVCGSRSIPSSLLLELGPWDLRNLETFQPQFLAGFQTERYTVDLAQGFEVAREIMGGEIRQLCCQDIGGDQQQLATVNTQHAAITFKHILQPVWLAPYRYRGELYRIAVNARTGEVVGTRPYSYWKIALLVAAILALVGLFAFLNSHSQG